VKLRHAAFGVAVGLATLAYTPSHLIAQEPWEGPPAEYQRDFERQAFHEGIEGARKDFQNHRKPDVNNRDEYRHPHVPDGEKEAYRAAFSRGYQVGVEHIWNGGGPR
jgi:hypothetical protein